MLTNSRSLSVSVIALTGYPADLLTAAACVLVLLAIYWTGQLIRARLPQLIRFVRAHGLMVTYHTLVAGAWVLALWKLTVPTLIVAAVAGCGQVLVVAQSAVRSALLAELDIADRARRAAFDMAKSARQRAKAVELQLIESGITPCTFPQRPDRADAMRRWQNDQPAPDQVAALEAHLVEALRRPAYPNTTTDHPKDPAR